MLKSGRPTHGHKTSRTHPYTVQMLTCILEYEQLSQHRGPPNSGDMTPSASLQLRHVTGRAAAAPYRR